MTNEEIAAIALAVHVRNALLERMNRHDLIPGDHFPEEWRNSYAEALRGAKQTEGLYDDPHERVHNMQRFLTGTGT